MKTFTTPLAKFLTLLAIILVALSVNYLYAAWTAPTAAPTGGNIDAPINTGANTQLKTGGTIFSTNLLADDLQVLSDAVPDVGTMIADFNGDVGAARYCDETGANCHPIADLVGGGPGLPAPTTADTYLYYDGSSVVWNPAPSGGGGLPGSCADGQVAKYDLTSSGWVCAADDGGSGGPALPLSCPSGQVLTGIASDGSAQCTSAPPNTCEHNGNTYSSGYRCVTSTASGGLSCTLYYYMRCNDGVWMNSSTCTMSSTGRPYEYCN